MDWSHSIGQQQDNILNIKGKLVWAVKNNYVATGKDKESSSIETYGNKISENKNFESLTGSDFFFRKYLDLRMRLWRIFHLWIRNVSFVHIIVCHWRLYRKGE